MQTKIIVSIIISLVLGLVVGVFSGIKYQQSKSPAFVRQTPGNTQGSRMGFRPTAGEIISVDDKSITVKLSDGSSKIVLVSDKTIINKADTAAKTDLKVGSSVSVFGQEGADGSVVAQTIQLGQRP